MSAKTLSHAMLSDPGRVRSHNEDACAANPHIGVFVVCDGVGGAASGEVASDITAKALLSQMVSAHAAGTALDVALKGAVEHANRLVHRQARQTAAQRGMATTLVALAFDTGSETGESGERVWIANIGDSRCYRLRQERLEQLTHDHSVVEEQVRAGVITRQQADVSPIRNVITRAIGSDAAVDADIECLPAQHGDLYLLCSDGLIRDLSDAEIAAILLSIPSATGESLANLCSQLIAAANARGGGDNITCILVHVA